MSLAILPSAALIAGRRFPPTWTASPTCDSWDNLPDARVSLLGFCLMTNHVHLIAVPELRDSLSILLRRVHGCYAQYYNTRSGRTGHLWQNRFFACVLGHDRLWPALAYVDRNPVRADIVQSPAGYRW
jgi:putative transposase